MANITYRINSNPAIPGTSTVKGTPLTNLEVDANFKALDVQLDAINTEDQTFGGVKTFTQPIVGALSIPTATILGRISAGTGPSEPLTAAQVQTIIGTETGAQSLINKTLVDPVLTLGDTNGTAGQVPVSQGAGLPPAWTDVQVMGAGGTTATGSVTLTAASPAMQSITTTGYGQSVTLPDATTLQRGVTVFGIFNAGAFPLLINDSAGTLLGYVDCQDYALCSLAANSTAAGNWDVFGAKLLGFDAGADVSSTGTVNQIGRTTAVNIDSDRVLLLVSYAIVGGTQSRLDGVVYNRATNSFGSCTLIRSNTGGSVPTFAASLIDSSRVLIVSKLGSASEATVLSISGMTITVNTPVSFTTTWGGIAEGELVAVGTSWLCGGASGANTFFNAITVSGTTPTVSAEQSVAQVSAAYFLVPYNSSVALLVNRPSASTSVSVMPIAVSGISITFGTAATATLAEFDILIRPVGARLFVLASSGTGVRGALFSVSGTVASATAAADVFTGFSATGRFVAAEVFGSQLLLVARTSSGTQMSANVLTDNSGSLIVGTELGLGGGFDTTTNNTAGFVAVSGNNILIQSGSPTSARWIGISGNNATLVSTLSIRFSVNPATDRLVCSPFSSNLALIGNEPSRTKNSVQGVSGSVYANSYTGNLKTAFINGAFKIIPATDDVNGFTNTILSARQSSASVWWVSSGSTTSQLALRRLTGV